MSLKLDDLRPCKSFLLLRLRPRIRVKSVVASVVAEITAMLASVPPGGGLAVSVVTKFPPVTARGLAVGGFHYVEERRAAWTSNPDVKDRLNHLVMVCQYRSMLAICLTDPSRREAVVRATEDPSKRGLHKRRQFP